MAYKTLTRLETPRRVPPSLKSSFLNATRRTGGGSGRVTGVGINLFPAINTTGVVLAAAQHGVHRPGPAAVYGRRASAAPG